MGRNSARFASRWRAIARYGGSERFTENICTREFKTAKPSIVTPEELTKISEPPCFLRRPACEVLDLSARTIERWREQGGGDDLRYGVVGLLPA